MRLSSALEEARRSTASRQSYLPDDLKGKEPNVDPKGSDVQAWTWEEDRQGRTIYMGVAFDGKKSRPTLYHVYRSPEQRQKSIETLIQARLSHAESKRARRAEPHGLSVGDILSSSWGYDQTNVDFYEVIEVRGKAVILRELAQKSAGETRVVPVPGKYTGEAIRRMPRGGVVKIDDVIRASKWSGKPMYVTPAMAGH